MVGEVEEGQNKTTSHDILKLKKGKEVGGQQKWDWNWD